MSGLLRAICFGCVLMVAGLAACSQNGAPDTSASAPTAGAPGTPASVQLTDAQVTVVHDGVKKIVANPDTAKFSKETAVSLAGKPGVHVCGYVNHIAAGGRTPDLPFYVELRGEAGQPVAHRGQVGQDDAKRAKVKFVCRHTDVQ